jgi:hypothetical protein
MRKRHVHFAFVFASHPRAINNVYMRHQNYAHKSDHCIRMLAQGRNAAGARHPGALGAACLG